MKPTDASQIAHPTRSHYRWVICALLFAATSINYVDRQIIGVLKPVLQGEFGWSEISFGDMVFWFQAAYALGYLGFGRVIDRVGVRLGYAAVVTLWTAAHIAHAFVSTVGGFIGVRFALGLGESGNFPAGLKAVAEWFPKRERALATGIFVAGSNIGAIVTPLIVPFMTLRWGWRTAFIATGSLSVVWLILWLKIYRLPQVHPKVSMQELALINSDSADAPRESRQPAKIPWRALYACLRPWAYRGGEDFSLIRFGDVSILAARFLCEALQPGFGALWGAVGRGLPAVGCRQRRGRLGVIQNSSGGVLL